MFDESENGPFEVSLGSKKTYGKKKVPDAPKLYVLKGIWSAYVLCSLSSEFYFVGHKIAADCFENEIKPSLKENYRLQFSQDVALNNVRD